MTKGVKKFDEEKLEISIAPDKHCFNSKEMIFLPA